MILSRYLVKDTLQALGAVMTVLLLIALSVQLLGLFNKVALGKINVELVMAVMGLSTFQVIVFILPLSFFIAVLLSLSRFYQDSEMAAITAAGVSQFFVIRAIAGLALLVAAIQAALTLQMTPWAEQQAQRLTEMAKEKSGIQGLTAGRFQSLQSGKGIIYTESLDKETNWMNNLFLQNRDENRQTMIKAESAHETTDEHGNRFIILKNGYRYEGLPGSEGFSITQFEEHGVRVDNKSLGILSLKQKSIPTYELWNNPTNQNIAELQWRISSALLCFTLAILAVPLSRTTPRQGRYFKLVLAIVFYIVFVNLQTVARSLIAEGKISPYLGIWWVHVLILLLALFFMIQMYGWRYYLNKQS